MEQEQLALFDDPPHAEDAPMRRALLGGRAVEFRFQRRRRRSIGIRVNEQGLSVAAPLRAPWREIEGFLREKTAWILGKLDERAALGTPVTIFGESGESMPLHGRNVALAIARGNRSVLLAGEELCVTLPAPHNRGAVRELLLRWLKARALETLAPRVAHYATRVSLPPPPFTLSNARSGAFAWRAAASASHGAWCTSIRSLPTMWSRTRSRTWSNSTTRTASGRWSNGCILTGARRASASSAMPPPCRGSEENHK